MSAARTRRSRSALLTAATLGVVLATGSVLVSAPAFAADAPAAVATATAAPTTSAASASAEPTAAAAAKSGKPSLTVKTPAVVGFAGGPVEFTETVTNPGDAEASYTLKLNASNVHARQNSAFAIDVKDADGTWKPVPLTFSQDSNTYNLRGKATGLTVPAGATKTFQFRIGVPMGTPHNGQNDVMGFNQPLKLHSALVDAAETTVHAEDTKDIKVRSLSVELEDLPAQAAAGQPAEFDLVVGNDSPSAYSNVTSILYADLKTSLEMRKADGTWVAVPSTISQPNVLVRYNIGAVDASIAPSTTVRTRLRLTFAEDATRGTTYLNSYAKINESPDGRGTLAGRQGRPIEVVDAAGPQLAINAPSAVGFAGGPVEFTETITNPGATEVKFDLRVITTYPGAAKGDSTVLQYQDADGAWKDVRLAPYDFEERPHFVGHIEGLAVPAGGSRTVKLRLGLPMGTAHNGDSGATHVNEPLHLLSDISTAKDGILFGASKDIEVMRLGLAVQGLPAEVVAGGAPVEFDYAVTNNSPSAYSNVTALLGAANPKARLEIRKADGSWEQVRAVPTGDATVPLNFHVNGVDADVAPTSTVTKRLRLSFPADAVLGETYVAAGVVINAGPNGAGTGQYPPGTPIKVVGKAIGTPGGVVQAGLTTTTGSGTTGTTASTGTGTTATATATAANGSLASTGSDGMEKTAMGAAALLLAGIGALFTARRRRRGTV
ncbi:hypothetical protein ACWGB8_19550 [Kitasatospora sp. NPDC054939]